VIVVDTNILVYRWLEGSRATDADRLTRVDPNWAAPLLWRSEFRNVLASYLRRSILNLDDAGLAVRKASACLLGGEHSVKDDVVLKLVSRSKCTSYDCEFVALALALRTFLVTEDAALLRNFPGYCRSLADAIAGHPR
jgi:predicted nucleic acid-binding protein